jgi:hypothetical protein
MPTDPHQNEPTHPAAEGEHPHRQHRHKHHAEPAPEAAAPPAPSPTITIAEPDPPPRTLVSEEPIAAKGNPQVITDGQVEIRAEGDKITARRVGDPVPANAPPAPPAPLSGRALSRRELELEAGRRAVARATEQQAHRPPMVKTANEISSEGSNNPVFRPGDFREYANMRQGNVSKDSGSSMLERVQRTLPEG